MSDRSACKRPKSSGAALCVFVLALLGLGPGAVGAQNPRGSLRGIVQDASGARVPGARIIVQATESSLQREVASDARGEFRLDDLPPGLYRITVQARGFADATAEVKVVLGSLREVTVTLKLQPIQESITLDGPGSITSQAIDTSSAVHQTIITSQDLETVPLAARSFANIAYLAPGAEPVEPSDPTKARITAISTGGSSGLNSDLSVDGANNTDDWIGGFLQNISPEAIGEFSVRTAQEDADTGGTTAASVVITTKSGTNFWHGSAGFYGRAADLNARFPIENPAPDPKQPFSRQNYVGTLGGPLKKDKLWFFSSFEYVHENASIAYSPASQSEFRALAQLAAAGLINDNGTGVSSIDVPPNVLVPFRDYLADARLDWAQSERARWFLRTSADSYTTHNAMVQQAALPSTGATSHNNYLSLVLSNQQTFGPYWVASFVFAASGLHLTTERNSQLGFALDFPFTSTRSTISGLETFGDNQFVTPITAFPVLRNQEKYQFRYDVTHTDRGHATRFGLNLTHEPVMSGALAAKAETVISYPSDPSFYAANPSQFYFSSQCHKPLPAGSSIGCNFTAAGDGTFLQNVQRLGIYAQDSWRVTPSFTVNYGLRYDTTFGLFIASGHDQSFNPALAGNGIVSGAPHDYRKAFAPRLGLAYAPHASPSTVLRGGVGLYYNDLAQNGWAEAFTAVNRFNIANGTGPASIIDPNYHTPYALHATAGAQHAFNPNWILSADWTLETGMHSYRRYDFPNVSIFRTDNRSSYKALLVHLQGNVQHRLNLVANYTLSSAKTWGCQIGELFDYVNGVCNPFNAFAPGDYGPSGEDVRHRLVLAGTVHAPAGFDVTFLSQAETARPITLTALGNRVVINGLKSTLDEFRGTPYVQTDLRVSRPIKFQERWTLTPFMEFFNLFNRNNPGNNYVSDISALPTPVNNLANVTSICLNPPACTQYRAVTSGNQLLIPAGALGDFFGPGTTVGIPFAAQVGVKLTF